MKLILHIGTPKTGTTHIQDTLSANYSTLLDLGFLYPKAGREFENRKLQPRHIGLRFACESMDIPANGLMPSMGLSEKSAREAYRNKFWTDLDHEISNSVGLHTVVLSDEALFIFQNERMTKELLSQMRPRFSEIEIVVYVRKPSDYLASSYSQGVKMGSGVDWKEHVSAKTSNPEYPGLYIQKIMVWASLSSSATVSVRAYQDDLVNKFCKRIGLHLKLERTKEKKVNPSLSTTGIHILRRINELSGDPSRRPGSIRPLFEKMATGQKWRLPSSAADKINRAAEDELRRLPEEFELTDEDRNIIESWCAPTSVAEDRESPAIDTETINETAEIIFELAKLDSESKKKVKSLLAQVSSLEDEKQALHQQKLELQQQKQALTSEISARRSKLANQIDWLDYRAHVLLANLPFLNARFKARMKTSAEKRYRTSYSTKKD